MFIRQLFDQDTCTFTYLVADESSAQAALIDPVAGQVERDLQLLNELGLKLTYVFDTHVHADHVTASGLLRERTAAKVVASRRGAECANLKVADGDEIAVGSVVVRVIETPGHTDDSVSYVVDNNVFTGDALLVRGTGRTDFQNGDPEQLYDSLTRKLFALPDDTVVWPGHDYRGHTSSSIGEEKRSNPRLAGRSKTEFVDIMSKLGLPPPRYINVAVPANRECGLGAAPSERASGFREVDAREIRKLAGDPKTTVIDVREPHEFVGELGHVPGAINVPYGEVNQAALELDFDTPIAVICRSGRRSRTVCERLVTRGFRNVHNLSGGMLEFNRAESLR